MITSENDYFPICLFLVEFLICGCLFISFAYLWGPNIQIKLTFLLFTVNNPSLFFFFLFCVNTQVFNYFEAKSFVNHLLLFWNKNLNLKKKILICFRYSMKARLSAIVMGKTRLNVGFMHHCCMILFLSKWKWNTHISSQYYRLHNMFLSVIGFFFSPVICNGYLAMLI